MPGISRRRTLALSTAVMAAISCTACPGSTRTVLKAVTSTVTDTETVSAAPTPSSAAPTSTPPAATSGIGRKYTERGLAALATAAKIAKTIPLARGLPGHQLSADMDGSDNL
jgi:hypothetical protein